MNILSFGAAGRMGKAVAAYAEEAGENVVCGVDVAPMSANYPLYPRLDEVTEAADVFLDFACAEGIGERLDFAAARGLPIVIGTTGLSFDDEESVRACARSVPVFRAGNLSLGVGLMCELVKRTAAVLQDFDIEIIERHHRDKRDAPSGTALMLAESVRTVRRPEYVFGRRGNCGPRARNEIGIHAVRGGTLAGEHEVLFAGEDETFTRSHSARSRKIFAAGAIRAARWLVTKEPGLYGMPDLVADIFA